MIDFIGYLASALVLISFMMKDIKTLRWVNLLGCAIFIAWGILIERYPVIVTNVGIVLVNIYYLFFKKSAE
ncbi:MAG: uroporphyrinogen decarboxylase [Crocinitomicaceae bacterium]